ncbi:hypothetical protein BJ742DRAFT_783675 [Cladochytrium replicatum]|nr:hypothetical protein BJ742DRAFT_783675 [Cladochytrium replicatum]
MARRNYPGGIISLFLQAVQDCDPVALRALLRVHGNALATSAKAKRPQDVPHAYMLRNSTEMLGKSLDNFPAVGMAILCVAAEASKAPTSQLSNPLHNHPREDALRNSIESVCTLLEACVDEPIDEMRWGENNTLLHLAAYLGTTNCVKPLLLKGASPTATNDRKVTPLDLCADDDTRAVMIGGEPPDIQTLCARATLAANAETRKATEDRRKVEESRNSAVVPPQTLSKRPSAVGSLARRFEEASSESSRTDIKFPEKPPVTTGKLDIAPAQTLVFSDSQRATTSVATATKPEESASVIRSKNADSTHFGSQQLRHAWSSDAIRSTTPSNTNLLSGGTDFRNQTSQSSSFASNPFVVANALTPMGKSVRNSSFFTSGGKVNRRDAAARAVKTESNSRVDPSPFPEKCDEIQLTQSQPDKKPPIQSLQNENEDRVEIKATAHRSDIDGISATKKRDAGQNLMDTSKADVVADVSLADTSIVIAAATIEAHAQAKISGKSLSRSSSIKRCEESITESPAISEQEKQDTIVSSSLPVPRSEMNAAPQTITAKRKNYLPDAEKHPNAWKHKLKDTGGSIGSGIQSKAAIFESPKIEERLNKAKASADTKFASIRARFEAEKHADISIFPSKDAQPLNQLRSRASEPGLAFKSASMLETPAREKTVDSGTNSISEDVCPKLETRKNDDGFPGNMESKDNVINNTSKDVRSQGEAGKTETPSQALGARVPLTAAEDLELISKTVNTEMKFEERRRPTLPPSDNSNDPLLKRLDAAPRIPSRGLPFNGSRRKSSGPWAEKRSLSNLVDAFNVLKVAAETPGTLKPIVEERATGSEGVPVEMKNENKSDGELKDLTAACAPELLESGAQDHREATMNGSNNHEITEHVDASCDLRNSFERRSENGKVESHRSSIEIDRNALAPVSPFVPTLDIDLDLSSLIDDVGAGWLSATEALQMQDLDPPQSPYESVFSPANAYETLTENYSVQSSPREDLDGDEDFSNDIIQDYDDADDSHSESGDEGKFVPEALSKSPPIVFPPTPKLDEASPEIENSPAPFSPPLSPASPYSGVVPVQPGYFSANSSVSTLSYIAAAASPRSGSEPHLSPSIVSIHRTDSECSMAGSLDSNGIRKKKSVRFAPAWKGELEKKRLVTIDSPVRRAGNQSGRLLLEVVKVYDIKMLTLNKAVTLFATLETLYGQRLNTNHIVVPSSAKEISFNFECNLDISPSDIIGLSVTMKNDRGDELSSRTRALGGNPFGSLGRSSGATGSLSGISGSHVARMLVDTPSKWFRGSFGRKTMPSEVRTVFVEADATESSEAQYQRRAEGSQSLGRRTGTHVMSGTHTISGAHGEMFEGYGTREIIMPSTGEVILKATVETGRWSEGSGVGKVAMQVCDLVNDAVGSTSLDGEVGGAIVGRVSFRGIYLPYMNDVEEALMPQSVRECEMAISVQARLSVPSCTGFLLQRGGDVEHWSRRYYQLVGNKLYACEPDTMIRCATVDLALFETVRELGVVGSPYPTCLNRAPVSLDVAHFMQSVIDGEVAPEPGCPELLPQYSPSGEQARSGFALYFKGGETITFCCDGSDKDSWMSAFEELLCGGLHEAECPAWLERLSQKVVS